VGTRHASRESALKILYRADILRESDVARLIDEHFQEHPEEAACRPFAAALVDGVTREGKEIDARLAGALRNWKLERLGYLERAILRIGAFEILYYPETPDKVAIDEAIELAKSFCEPDSARLINGALDNVMNEKTGSGTD